MRCIRARASPSQRARVEIVKLKPVLRSGNETLLHMAALEGMGLAFLPEMAGH